MNGKMLLSLLFPASTAFLVARAQNTSDNLQKYTISAPGINASFIGYGARMTNVLVNDKNGMPQDILLGYDDASRYINDTEHEHTYFGAVGAYLISQLAVIPTGYSRRRTFEILGPS